MNRSVLALVLLLSGCSLINDFDRFTFGGSQADELEHDAGKLERDAGLRDAGELEHDASTHPDAGELEHDASTHPDAGELEHDAGLRDAGSGTKQDAGLCLDPTMFICAEGWQGLPCDTCPGGVGCFGPCD